MNCNSNGMCGFGGGSWWWIILLILIVCNGSFGCGEGSRSCC